MAQPGENHESNLTGYLARFWDAQRANGFADLAGTDIAVAVPVTQAVLDDLLSPVSFPDPIRGFRLRFAGDDLVVFEVGLNLFLFKTTVRVEARVERYVPFPHEPVLKLTLLSGGVVEMGLNVVPFPDWIKINGREARLDLGKLLKDGGNGWLIPLLRDVKFGVHSGVLNLTGRIVVPDADTPTT